VLPEQITVVGGEDHDGLAQGPRFSQRAEELADLAVHRLDRAERAAPVPVDLRHVPGLERRQTLHERRLVADVGLAEGGPPGGCRAGVGILVARARNGGSLATLIPGAGAGVGCEVVELEVEGAPARRLAANDPARDPAQRSRQVIARLSAEAAAAAVGRELVVVVATRAQGGAPPVPARRDLVLPPLALVPVEEPADMDGPVAGALEPPGEDVARCAQAPVVVAEHAVVVPVLARRERRARRAAQWRRDHEVGERRAAIGQVLEGPGHVAPLECDAGLVVGDDHQHVRRRARRFRNAHSRE
jgi:hypothetical protein